MTVTASDKGFL